MKVTEEIRKNRLKWVKALESGRYKQGRFHLVDIDDNGGNKYCCLGVWGRVSRREEVYTEVCNEALSPLGRRSLGMTKNQEDRAIHMNDSIGSTFKEIAAYFRKIWKIEDDVRKL